ncbi:MAG: 4Fe-4S dicluster domain-containing protein, partial [Mariniblastus sp.]
MNLPILQPEDHVLSTLEADGSRRWLKPKLSKDSFLRRRRVVAYVLIAIFTVLPFIKFGGKPFVLIDIVARRFTIFGFTFLPTDTVLLAIFMVGFLLSIVLFTALFGRVWCGWACPQTVYMEFLFRPVERFFDGTVGRGGHKKNIPVWRTVAKYIVYFLLSVYLANTFLAYFIGVDRLSQWVTRSPLSHPIPFAIMAFVTFAMMVDFCFFREQMCVIACPYGRFQSVLLDQNSLIVAYDKTRGEPRGKVQKKSGSDNALPVLGDCIGCGNCLTTCPTGIDIRDGLQMECINCT